MELRQLEHFVAVVEAGPFTRAAACNIAQSGLSASIRALERDLGADLVYRSTRRLELTDAGGTCCPRPAGSWPYHGGRRGRGRRGRGRARPAGHGDGVLGRAVVRPPRPPGRLRRSPPRRGDPPPYGRRTRTGPAGGRTGARHRPGRAAPGPARWPRRRHRGHGPLRAGLPGGRPSGRSVRGDRGRDRRGGRRRPRARHRHASPHRRPVHGRWSKPVGPLRGARHRHRAGSRGPRPRLRRPRPARRRHAGGRPIRPAGGPRSTWTLALVTPAGERTGRTARALLDVVGPLPATVGSRVR